MLCEGEERERKEEREKARDSKHVLGLQLVLNMMLLL